MAFNDSFWDLNMTRTESRQDTSIAWKAMARRSLDCGIFVDTKFYAYSRRSSDGLVYAPIPIYANARMLLEAKPSSSYMRECEHRPMFLHIASCSPHIDNQQCYVETCEATLLMDLCFARSQIAVNI